MTHSNPCYSNPRLSNGCSLSTCRSCSSPCYFRADLHTALLIYLSSDAQPYFSLLPSWVLTQLCPGTPVLTYFLLLDSNQFLPMPWAAALRRAPLLCSGNTIAKHLSPNLQLILLFWPLVSHSAALSMRLSWPSTSALPVLSFAEQLVIHLFKAFTLMEGTQPSPLCPEKTSLYWRLTVSKPLWATYAQMSDTIAKQYIASCNIPCSVDIAASCEKKTKKLILPWPHNSYF